MANTLSNEELRKIDAYWRAANYLSVGQIYLRDNPLLERPLTVEDIKPRLLGHFGTTPGLNFIYVLSSHVWRQDHNGFSHQGIWEWAGNEDRTAGTEPDVVIACAGDVPTMEALAAVTVLRDWAPDLKMIRFINVVDLFTLEPPREHPHGINDEDFDRMFTKTQPVIFAFHGYPMIVHKLTYRRTDHDNFHVHGFKVRGTTTTPFDMTVLNELDRYTLALDAARNVPRLASQVAETEQRHSEMMERHRLYVSEYGEDMPEVRDWKWSPAR